MGVLLLNGKACILGGLGVEGVLSRTLVHLDGLLKLDGVGSFGDSFERMFFIHFVGILGSSRFGRIFGRTGFGRTVRFFKLVRNSLV